MAHEGEPLGDQDKKTRDGVQKKMEEVETRSAVKEVVASLRASY